MRVSDLKRKIEKEFVDLFPDETPYIVAKLEDTQGFSMSNQSLVGDFLKSSDHIYARPENLGVGSSDRASGDIASGLVGGGNINDMLEMLRSVQKSVVNKIAKSPLK